MTERLNKAVIKIRQGSLMEVGRERHQKKFKHRGHAVRREYSKHGDLTYVRDETRLRDILMTGLYLFFNFNIPNY